MELLYSYVTYGYEKQILVKVHNFLINVFPLCYIYMQATCCKRMVANYVFYEYLTLSVYVYGSIYWVYGLGI